MKIFGKLRDFEFSLALIESAYERNEDIKALVTERLNAIADWYLNRYLPNVLYQTILKVPKTGQVESYFAAPVGLLKNTPVDKFMLKPGIKRTIRNNYKAISNATAGISYEDLQMFIDYFTEMADISDSNIVVYATRGTISKLSNVLADPGTVDEFERTGKPATTIKGIRFVEDDRIPQGKMLMIDGEANDIIVHVVSPKKDLQGFGATKDIGEGFTKFEKVHDFVGSYWRVCPEGRFIKGRHKMMWIDLNHNSVDGDEQNMSPEGLAELEEYYKLYEQYWRRSVA